MNAQLRALWRSCRLLGQSAPSQLRRLVLLNLVFGAGPALLLYLGKVVIDETSRLLGRAPVSDPLGTILSSPALLWSIAAFIAINIVLDSVETISGFEFSSLRDRLQGTTKSRIYRKIAEFEDIALFESPELLNALHLAQQGIPRLMQLANVATNLMTGIFVLIPVVLLSLTIAWWVPLLIFVTAIPSVWAQLHYENKSWSVEEAQAGVVRQMDINERILTGEEYAKELRLFRLQPLILSRWSKLFWSAYDEMQSVRRRGAFAVVGWSVLSGLGAGLPYTYVIVMALRGAYTLGDLALYAGLVFQIRRSLFIFFGNLAHLQEIGLASNAIFRFLELEPQLRRHPSASDTGAAPRGIEIAHVAFSYPASGTKAVDNVSLAISTGEMVVVVGENGAGKTTLAKLLCRLYDPQEGHILWDGTDIRSIDLDALRERIGVVMQDYARFPASVRENIAFGQLQEMENDASILAAARSAGIAEALQRLPLGLDTPLTKQLEGGVALSGGQWQRIAIARALLRHPQVGLVIMDEPTAALDPQTEHEVLEVFRRMARDRIAIVISHRLALARIADRIVVMERGRIVEVGSHRELMDAGGHYHTMFTRQASSYVGSEGTT